MGLRAVGPKAEVTVARAAAAGVATRASGVAALAATVLQGAVPTEAGLAMVHVELGASVEVERAVYRSDED